MDAGNVSNKNSLQWVDYLIIGVVLSISAGIGVYYRFTGGRQRTVEEYFSADRSMKVLPLSIALTVSFMSAITLLGISVENYVHGTMFVVIYLGILLTTPVAIYMYLPVFFELKCTSVFEYLERRFGVGARMVASTANFLHLLLYTGVVLFAPSLALEATTGLSGTMSIILIGVICTFYSTIGGIKAVLITDVFQAVLMFVAIFCVLGIADGDIEGGLANVWNIATENKRIDFYNFSLDPTERHTWWNLLIAGATIYLSLFGVNQVQVQRLLTVKDLRASQIALLLNTPFTLLLAAFTSYSGLVLYAIYKDCDPVASGKISSNDMIMPYFAAERMSRVPGLTGLFVSGIFCATLSTISAMLNSLAAVALEDYIKPLYTKIGVEFPVEKSTLIGKVLAMGNGVVCLLLAFLARGLGSLVEAAIIVTGIIGGPLLGIFTLGMFFETPNEIGAITGMITALITSMWAAFGQPRPRSTALPVSIEGCDNSTLSMITRNITKTVVPQPDASSYFYLYRISYVWYNPMGMAITVIVGLITSLIVSKVSRGDTRELDPNLFTPLLAARIRRRRQDAAKTTSSQLFVLEPSTRE